MKFTFALSCLFASAAAFVAPRSVVVKAAPVEAGRRQFLERDAGADSTEKTRPH